MFNYLAGLFSQLVLLMLFEHKSDAIVFGVLLIVLLLLKHYRLIAFTRIKPTKAPSANKVIERRVLL